MKIGIIGYGNIGKIRHEMCHNLLSDAEYLIYDPAIENCEDPEQIIDWCDAVFICTPNYLTKDYTVSALRKNKHIFCEKPPALNYYEMLEIQDEYEEANCTLIYGFNHRQYDSIQKMKSIIDDPNTGKILWMRGRYGKAMGDPNTGGWRSDPKLSGGGILLDQGIHMLDLMNWFGGKFDVVQSIVTNNLWKIEGLEDNAFLNLYNSEGNVSASLHSTMIEWRHIFSLEVVLEKGYIALNGLKTPSGSYGKEVLTICEDKHFESSTSRSEIIEFKNNNTWEKEVFNFLYSIMNKNNSSNIDDAIEVMRLIKEAYNENR
jgi:1,5-anhydro-D-fructose reductase (1,5-anhydro-D-mannitol-forming)